MDRDEILRQGKQTAADLRDTVSQKVSENEDTIKGTLGKAARWVDEKTGGKYAEHIGKVESKVGEGIGWVASQGPAGPASGEPGAPGAAAGDPAPGTARTGAPRPPAPRPGRSPPRRPGAPRRRTPRAPPGPRRPARRPRTARRSRTTDAPRPPQV